jgi:hypothetical protein
MVLGGAVMKKPALAIALIVELILLAVILEGVSLVKANPFFKDNYCDISIHSPQNITYGTGNIILDFTAKTKDYILPEYDYFYSLDGEDFQSSIKVEDVQIVSEEEITNESIVPYTETILMGQAELSLLANGAHSIKVFSGHFVNGKINYVTADPYSATADFIILSGTASPSPEPTNYSGVRLSETEIIIGATIIVAIVIFGLGLLLYLIKSKR